MTSISSVQDDREIKARLDQAYEIGWRRGYAEARMELLEHFKGVLDATCQSWHKAKEHHP